MHRCRFLRWTKERKFDDEEIILVTYCPAGALPFDPAPGPTERKTNMKIILASSYGSQKRQGEMNEHAKSMVNMTGYLLLANCHYRNEILRTIK